MFLIRITSINEAGCINTNDKIKVEIFEDLEIDLGLVFTRDEEIQL